MHAALESTQLVICDLDGTLINSLPDLAAALDLTLEEADLPRAGEEKVSHWIGNGTRMLVRRALVDAGMDELRVESELDRHLECFNRHYSAHPCDQTYIYSGVVPFLDAIKAHGIRLAIVTNKPGPFVKPILERLGLSEYFSVVLGGDALPEKKPDPAPLLHVCKLLDVDPSHSLMIGDSRNDIQAAHAASMRSLAVSYGYNHGEPIEQSAPGWLVDSLEEVIA